MILNKTSLPGVFFLLAIIILLTGTACSEKKQIRGKEFIPRETMVEIMRDIHLLDGITNDVKYYRKYNPNDSIVLYGQIFIKHGYDRASFDSTLVEYARNPKLLDALYADVMMELNLLQNQVQKEEEEMAKQSAEEMTK